MGSFAAGLGRVGESIAGAEELQRQDAERAKKLAIEQLYANIQKQYANTNAQRSVREQEEFDLRKKLASEPKFVGFRSVGGRLYYGLQNPDGTIKTEQVNGVDATQDAEAIEKSIETLPKEAQDVARGIIVPYLQSQDYVGARAALKPVLQKYAVTQLPQPTTTSSSTITDSLTGGTQTRTTTTSKGFGPAPKSASSVKPTAKHTDNSVDKWADKLVSGEVTAKDVNSAFTGKTGDLLRQKIYDAALKKGWKSGTGTLRPEMQSGLKVLHVSLFGDGETPGLKQAVTVLDSPGSRAKLIAAGVGSTPNPKEWITTKFFHSAIYAQMSPEEKAYVYQLNRAISAIQALRSVTGLPRSTQQLMDQYIRELPDPVTTPSSQDALNKIALVEREVRTALDNPQAAHSGPADIDSVLDEVFGKKKQ